MPTLFKSWQSPGVPLLNSQDGRIVHRCQGRYPCSSTVLHCCGNTTDRVRYFAQAGFDCYHFESQVNIQSAITDAGRMALMGNINNPEILFRGTTEQVAAACAGALRAGMAILAPECAVPLTTPLENLRVLVKVAESAP
jgi:uroporphyrinogen-III decarboxylase